MGSPSPKRSHFAVSLRVRHPSIDPDEITKAIRWQPTDGYRAGDPRRTPKGHPLTGTNKETFWYTDLAAGDEKSLPALIRRANQHLAQHKNFLEELVKGGGSVEYFVGWFLDSNTGELFDWQLLQECAALRISLAFDIYPAGRAGAAEQ